MSDLRWTVDDAGKVGINRDVDPIRLPPEAWTDGNNVRFTFGEIRKILGETLIDVTLTSTGGTYTQPLIRWEGGTQVLYWVHADNTNVYKIDGSNETNITRYTTTEGDNDYTGDNDDRWNSCMNQNVFFMTNGADVPQQYTDATNLTDLDWDSGNTWADKGYLTKVLRPFKNHLVALQWYDGAAWNPHTVYWSNAAEPYAVPSDWDFSDKATGAGFQDLTSTPGNLVDCLTLRDYNVVYKEDAMTLMGYVGGQSIMSFRDISNTTGLLAQDCAAEFYGQHFVVANDDIISHDGNTIQSIVDGAIRKTIFSEIDGTNYKRSYVVPYHNKSEMWFCYPTIGSLWPNKAAIWNYKTGAWTFRSLLGDLRYIAPGIHFPDTGEVLQWNDDNTTWDSDSTTWDERMYNPTVRRLIGTNGSALLTVDDGYVFNGSSYSSYVTKEWIKLSKMDTINHVKAVYVKGQGEMNVWVGSAMHQNDAFTWEGPYNITPEGDAQIRCRVTGRYHAIKFEFVGDSEHKLQSYEMLYVPTGYGR